jgi:ribonucleotide reductase alpha subunit
MLQTMGCSPKISEMHPARQTKIKGQLVSCRRALRLLLAGSDVWRLRDLGWSPARLNFEGAERSNRGVARFPTVVSVEPLEAPEPTFCFTEPLRGRGVFEGVLTGNCGEISIPSWADEGNADAAEYGVCNLAAIPLNSFLIEKDSAAPRVDWEGIQEAAAVAAANLDSSIDLGFYPVEACRRSNVRHRPIAIGVMGLADVLARLRLAYGSPEARELDSALHAAIYLGAMRESAERGARLGSFQSYPGSPSAEGLLQPDLWVKAGDLPDSWEDAIAATTGGAIPASRWTELREACRAGLRNSYVTASMPTATSSQVVGQNEAFEPFTSNLYTRKTLAGEFVLLNPHLVKELEGAGLWTEALRHELIAAGGSVQALDLPSGMRARYLTAREIDQTLLTAHAAARGPFISQTQSLNYFFSEPTLDKFLTTMVYGWRAGLTTGSYYIHTAPAAGAQIQAMLVKTAEPELAGPPAAPSAPAAGAQIQAMLVKTAEPEPAGPPAAPSAPASQTSNICEACSV